jgi:hypothetical protein
MCGGCELISLITVCASPSKTTSKKPTSRLNCTADNAAIASAVSGSVRKYPDTQRGPNTVPKASRATKPTPIRPSLSLMDASQLIFTVPVKGGCQVGATETWTQWFHKLPDQPLQLDYCYKSETPPETPLSI